MNEEQFWRELLKGIENDKTTILLAIINREGSAPNVPGAKMFVSEDKIIGTIGGGNSEHKLVEKAKKKIAENDLKVENVFLEHREETSEYQSGMICSGSQNFALVPITKEDKNEIVKIINVFSKAKPRVLRISEEGIKVKVQERLENDKSYVEKGESWKYQEQIGLQNKLFIIGGGHVSLALSKVMQTLDFHITVYDNRENLVTMDLNSYANQKSVVSYEEIEKFIPEGENIYVAIMTFGHKSDELVLEKLVNKNLRYLGMMASKAKKKQVFENLERQGTAKKSLDKVHSPIGVKITSDTPEEIAISIAAEIISVKNT